MSNLQIQSQINKIPSQLNKIEVPKRVYNVIRSIVDSSTKQTYEWNKPIVVDMKTVKFVKYKVLQNNVEVKAWEIVIEPMIIQKEETELNATLISVWDGCNRLVADLIIRSEFTSYEPRKPYTMTITSKPDNIEINAGSIHEFERYFVSPSDPVSYAKPISLAAFVSKLMLFLARAKNALQNA
jgi:hypothetical protein